MRDFMDYIVQTARLVFSMLRMFALIVKEYLMKPGVMIAFNGKD